jgi:hypothetical protein
MSAPRPNSCRNPRYPLTLRLRNEDTHGVSQSSFSSKPIPRTPLGCAFVIELEHGVRCDIEGNVTATPAHGLARKVPERYLDGGQRAEILVRVRVRCQFREVETVLAGNDFDIAVPAITPEQSIVVVAEDQAHGRARVVLADRNLEKLPSGTDIGLVVRKVGIALRTVQPEHPDAVVPLVVLVETDAVDFALERALELEGDVRVFRDFEGLVCAPPGVSVHHDRCAVIGYRRARLPVLVRVGGGRDHIEIEAFRTAQHAHVAETAVAAGSIVVIVHEHQIHCAAGVIVTCRYLVVLAPAAGVVVEIVIAAVPVLRSRHLEYAYVVVEGIVLVEADPLHLALVGTFEVGQHVSGVMLKARCLALRIVGQRDGRAAVLDGYRGVRILVRVGHGRQLVEVQRVAAGRQASERGQVVAASGNESVKCRDRRWSWFAVSPVSGHR